MSYAAENEEQEDEEQDILVLRTLELLLPSFYRKLDEHGELDLMDAMPANQYKGNGVHLLAIQPSDGSIHSICYGRSNVPLDFYDEENEAAFEAFAKEALLTGLVPIQCYFADWFALYPRLYFVL